MSDGRSGMPPIVAFIVAVAENGAIGYRGALPWHQRSDLKRFRKLTFGKPVIMGRATFASIGKPLDGRDNIVISRSPGFAPEGVIVCAAPAAALAVANEAAIARGSDEIMVIGGAQIYAHLLPMARRIYLTRIHASPEGDTFFPEPDPVDWSISRTEPLDQGPGDDWPATLIVFEHKSCSGNESKP
ncbi:MAG: dihydrofolate reductase, partial [Hyphomicrobiaceae bacterium]|nr:dihydrofolate reductase [Hyphomicrobiaceae bacterium]